MSNLHDAQSAGDKAHTTTDTRRSSAGGASRQGRRPGERSEPLANTANSCSPDRFRARYEALHELWKFSENKRVRKCKRVLAKDCEYVGVRHTDGAVGFANLQTCGSTWLCPVCSARIAQERKSEVQRALEWNAAQGGDSVHITLTVRHHKGHRLASTWDAVQAGWRRLRPIAWCANRSAGR